jgi:hypothetical protein
MAIASLDGVMLREPRLLVPGMQPIGKCVVDPENSLYKKYFSATAQCWVPNKPDTRWPNLTRAGSKYDLVAGNENAAYPQVPKLLSGQRGLGIGHADSGDTYLAGGYSAATSLPSATVYKKTWHIYLDTKNVKGTGLHLIRESFSRISHVP